MNDYDISTAIDICGILSHNYGEMYDNLQKVLDYTDQQMKENTQIQTELKKWE